jgi:hypothetical protein
MRLLLLLFLAAGNALAVGSAQVQPTVTITLVRWPFT